VEITFPGARKPSGFANDLLALEEIQKRAERAPSQMDVTALYEAARELLDRYPTMLQALQAIADKKPATRRGGGRGQRDMLQDEK
jgi:hypothetical protein